MSELIKHLIEECIDYLIECLPKPVTRYATEHAKALLWLAIAMILLAGALQVPLSKSVPQSGILIFLCSAGFAAGILSAIGLDS